MNDGSFNDGQYVFKPFFFREEDLRSRIRYFAHAEGLTETMKALEYAYERHEGQLRKKGPYSTTDIPYIIHPMTMTAQAHASGISDDVILASTLLHDVVEDTGVSIGELPFSDDVKKIVGLLTFTIPEGMSRKEAKKLYFGAISADPRASLIKLLDRCSNVSTMVECFDEEKLLSYIEETETFILPLADILATLYPQYEKTAFQAKYQILAVIETIKYLISARR